MLKKSLVHLKFFSSVLAATVLSVPIAAENPGDYNKKIGGFALRKWRICGECKNTFSFRIFCVILSKEAKIGVLEEDN